jgi:hypothetical protein
MAGPITIPIERDAGYAVGERIEVEVAGVVQPDLVLMWDSGAALIEAGGGTPAELRHVTLSRFVAGDYSVRLRGIDLAGNVGDWSSAVVIEHRPKPAAPTGLVVVGDELRGDWVDG